MAAHLNEEEGKTESAGANAEQGITDNDDDCDDNEAENEVPLEVVKLKGHVSQRHYSISRIDMQRDQTRVYERNETERSHI